LSNIKELNPFFNNRGSKGKDESAREGTLEGGSGASWGGSYRKEEEQKLEKFKIEKYRGKTRKSSICFGPVGVVRQPSKPGGRAKVAFTLTGMCIGGVGETE